MHEWWERKLQAAGQQAEQPPLRAGPVSAVSSFSAARRPELCATGAAMAPAPDTAVGARGRPRWPVTRLSTLGLGRAAGSITGQYGLSYALYCVSRWATGTDTPQFEKIPDLLASHQIPRNAALK